MTQRPSVFAYSDFNQFVADMLKWKKESDPDFSLRSASSGVVGCSPSLISLVASKKRKLTMDRVQGFSKILQLTAREKSYLKSHLMRLTQGTKEGSSDQRYAKSAKSIRKSQRASPSNHIFSQWWHPYIKDVSRLKGFEPDAKAIFRLFRGLFSEKNIQSSLAFLLREGYLRRTPLGQVVENDVLTESVDEVSSKEIRRFHKNALKLAALSLDSCPLEQRETSTLLLPLNRERFLLLKSMIKEWAEETASIAEEYPNDNERLYQLTVNLCPVAGTDLS